MNISNLPWKYFGLLPAEDANFVNAILSTGCDARIFDIRCGNLWNNLDIFVALVRHNYVFDIEDICQSLKDFIEKASANDVINVLLEILDKNVLNKEDHERILLLVLRKNSQTEIVDFVLNFYQPIVSDHIMREAIMENVTVEIFHKLFVLSNLTPFEVISSVLNTYSVSPQFAIHYELVISTVDEVLKLIPMIIRESLTNSFMAEFTNDEKWITEYVRDYLGFDFNLLDRKTYFLIENILRQS
jgi:hypothetical protein